MTRRDRAAMVLAYECVRNSPTGAVALAREALRFTDFGLPLALADAENEWDDAIDEPIASRAWYAAHYYGLRLLRARLALYLRAVLRADAGDCWPMVEHATQVAGGRGTIFHSTRRIYRPLWEQAPASKGGAR